MSTRVTFLSVACALVACRPAAGPDAPERSRATGAPSSSAIAVAPAPSVAPSASPPPRGKYPMGQMFYCAANYVTSFRVNGATQTLAKSVLTVCRNDRCYSRNLKDLPLGRISRVGFSMRGYLFPEPTAARNTPWITVEMSWSANCGVYCDLWVTYKCAPGDSLSACTESDMTHDGDVYEVSIRSPSGRKQSLRDTAHYDVFTFDGKECDSFKTDHTDEAMWTLD